MRKLFTYATTFVTAMLVAAMAQSCAMMTEDLEPCVEYTEDARTAVCVQFKYDYNIQRADMFNDHVGAVRLFVIDDATNTVVRDTIVCNRDYSNALRQHDFAITFTDLTQGQAYRFAAMALQRPYDETLQHAEDKFVGTFPNKTQSITNLKVNLTHSETPDTLGRYAVTAPSCGLDTLWMGRTTHQFIVPQRTSEKEITCDTTVAADGAKTVARHITYIARDTVSLMRDTKYLAVSLHNLDAPTAIDHQDFRVEITYDNARLDWDNSIIPTVPLLYTPHAQWTAEALDYENNVTDRTAHYDLSFSRLMYHTSADTGKNARLRILRNSDNHVVADINLPSHLAMGRKAYEQHNYSEQEYLDREYNYDLHFFIRGDQWLYASLRINVLAWAIRIDNQTL